MIEDLEVLETINNDLEIEVLERIYQAISQSNILIENILTILVTIAVIVTVIFLTNIIKKLFRW